MTAPVDLIQSNRAIVIPKTWAPILSGAISVGDGTQALVTVSAAPTPQCTIETRVTTRATANVSDSHVFTGADTHRFNAVTVDDTGGDVVVIEARRLTGRGGLLLIDWAGLQGLFTDQPGSPAGTETGITAQPTNKTVEAGNPATFTVTAVGVNLSYQWEEWDTIGWANVGADQPAHTVGAVTQAMDGYQYRVTVTGDNDPPGGPVVSNTVTLTVTTSSAVITSEPVDVEVVEGGTATYTVQATGVVSFELYRRTGGTGTGSLIWSGTNPGQTISYTTPIVGLADDGAEYRYTLQGSDAVDVFSRWALLTVTSEPVGGLLVTDTEVD